MQSQNSNYFFSIAFWMSLRSIVPITIFSELTVTFAFLLLTFTLTKTNVPDASVLAENLKTFSSDDGTWSRFPAVRTHSQMDFALLMSSLTATLALFSFMPPSFSETQSAVGVTAQCTFLRYNRAFLEHSSQPPTSKKTQLFRVQNHLYHDHKLCFWLAFVFPRMYLESCVFIYLYKCSQPAANGQETVLLSLMKK